MPSPGLPEGIALNQAGHITSHDTVHDILNEHDYPNFKLRGVYVDVLANRPAASALRSGALFYASDVDQAFICDGALWQGLAVLSIDNVFQGSITTQDQVIHSPRQTFADGDTTPSVLGGNYFQTANTGATVITDLDDMPSSGVVEITILFGDGHTSIAQNDTFMKLAWGIQFDATANDQITLVGENGVWVEKCRSINEGIGS